MHKYKKQEIAKKYLNRYVKIKTVHGTYKGKIVNVDNGKVYLSNVVSARRNGKDGKAHISFFPFILPLVLFELLVIVLIPTPGRGCCC
ncbi:hypothetical protein [Cohnella lupini]|uniref:Uncharacterized protein n=1 Tax=Cohnella lupini TaxID=1294267 RepID=A0A3D9I148_9BACL|nr:hypothetical protein [Cohnella lupini]RED55492.1 hypothetical protein DFP95_11726 [Cohnella lupini]